MTISKSSL